MTKPLTVEQRCNIARAVTQQPWKYLYGTVILDGDKELSYWEPEKNIWHREALISEVARMIESLQKHESDIYDYLERFNSALAANNTQEIELLAWELLEGK